MEFEASVERVRSFIPSLKFGTEYNPSASKILEGQQNDNNERH